VGLGQFTLGVRDGTLEGLDVMVLRSTRHFRNGSKEVHWPRYGGGGSGLGCLRNTGPVRQRNRPACKLSPELGFRLADYLGAVYSA
jgi:hypothetical protein